MGQRSKHQPSKSFTAVIQPFTVTICGAFADNRTSEASLVRIIGKPSSRETLVMKSTYERPLSLQTLGKGKGKDRPNVTCDFGCSQ